MISKKSVIYRFCVYGGSWLLWPPVIDVCIVRCGSGRHWRRRSMLNSINGTRTLICCRLTNEWRKVVCRYYLSFVSEAFFELTNASEWGDYNTETIAIKRKYNWPARLLNKACIHSPDVFSTTALLLKRTHCCVCISWSYYPFMLVNLQRRTRETFSVRIWAYALPGI